MLFKKGEIKDAEAMWHLSEESYRDGSPWQLQDFKESLTNRAHYVLCLFNQGRLVGFIQWQQVVDEGEILNIVVNKAMQRKGLGEKLLMESLEQLSKLGVSHFFLEVRQDNLAGIALYKKIGFEKIAIRRNYYQNPVADGFVFYLEGGMLGKCQYLQEKKDV